MSHALDGISGNGVNGILVITAARAIFSAPSTSGTLNHSYQLTFSVGNLTGGTLNFEYDIQLAPANGTPQFTFDLIIANGQILCVSRQDIRPYPSLCDSSNRCNKVNITFSNPTIPQVPGFVLSGIATTSPLSETFFTQLTISLINFERRTECPNANPTPWQSLMQNPPIIQPAGMTNACVKVSNTPTVVNTPVANSIQFTTNSPKQQTNTSFEHFLQFRGVPEKQSGACQERLRITLRYFFRNNKGCEVEMYRIAEVVR
ncbi:hypothetical protein JCM31826_12820 [Thermaurantimonas aggregans]|uniref:Uncharacterized protein n=2 Tax=Thermaurantimonas aggregans TaxID=2173829 RepID=A0A401XLD3_9FLAO|nr:hypothetical protein JCM31826_12820 [Thermaurantimonas aggregans]